MCATALKLSNLNYAQSCEVKLGGQEMAEMVYIGGKDFEFCADS